MARKKENDYFEMFVQNVEYTCQASTMLHANFLDFNPDQTQQHIDELHKIEHAADIAKHELMGKLLREFITPIDREDIIDLASAIDDVTDAIEDVAVRIFMFNVRELRPDAAPFAALIRGCCSELRSLMEEFAGFRKSKTISDRIIGLNRLEEEGDKLYMQAMRTLHSTSTDPAERLVWTMLYDLLEKCCDKCEDVADVVERVILKNS